MMDLMFNVDWGRMLRPDAPLLETFVRGSVTFFVLFVLLRMLKRQIGGLGLSDLLVLVLIADAAADGMLGGATSVTNGVVLVATIIFWNYVFNWLDYRAPGFHRLFQSPALPLVKNGQLLRHNMRREFITHEELMSQLRLQGIDDVTQVRAAYLEADGRISVLDHDDQARGTPEQHPA